MIWYTFEKQCTFLKHGILNVIIGGKPNTPRSPLATVENSNNSPRKALGSKKSQGVKSGLSILSSGDKQSMRVGSGYSHNWALDKENQAWFIVWTYLHFYVVFW